MGIRESSSELFSKMNSFGWPLEKRKKNHLWIVLTSWESDFKALTASQLVYMPWTEAAAQDGSNNVSNKLLGAAGTTYSAHHKRDWQRLLSRALGGPRQAAASNTRPYLLLIPPPPRPFSTFFLSSFPRQANFREGPDADFSSAFQTQQS
jgi:hypothetical protein